MDIFKLFGTIAINNDSAMEKIGETSESANALSKTFSAVGSAALKIGKVAGVGLAAAATATSMLFQKSVAGYADYEQLQGGIKKLYGDSADAMMEYAQNAYKTAGMSANQYMEQATSFASALIKSCGGDQAKAAEITDMAMRDMSDNANTYGTDMQSILNAYQGFSKQNYTMLDNLKLGYGGTQAEMKRLLSDAQKIQKQNGVNVKYNIKNLDDIYEAIHVIQEANGVAGTTAAEAAETISGSWNSAKASFDNMIVGMADGTQDMDMLIGNFAGSAVNVVKNVAKILPTIASGFSEVIKGIAPEIPGIIESVLPSVLDGAIALIAGLASALPGMLSAVGTAISNAWKNIVWPKIQGIFKEKFGIELPDWEDIGTEIQNGWNTVLTKAAPVIDAVRSKFESVTNFFSETFSPVFEKIAPIIESAKQALQPLGEKVTDVKNKISAFISKAVEYVENGSAAKDATDLLKNAFQWLANACIAVIDGVTQFATWCKENKTTIIVLTVIISSFAIAWALVNGAVKIWSAVSEAAAAGTSLLSAAIGALTSPVTLAILAIGALIAAVALCIIYWDKITAAIDSAALKLAEFFGIDVPEDWSLCKSIADGFTWVCDKISSAISLATDFLRLIGLIEEKRENTSYFTVNDAEQSGMTYDQIMAGLANGTVSNPRTGGMGGGHSTEGKSYYDGTGNGIGFAKGGVFSKPTFFDTRLGNTMVGEAGPEAVAPIDVLQGYVAQAVAGQNAMLVNAIERMVEAVEKMDANMGGNMRDALEDTSLKINNREFARMVKAVG